VDLLLHFYDAGAPAPISSQRKKRPDQKEFPMLKSPRRSSVTRGLWLLRATPLVLAAMVAAMLSMSSSGAAAAGIGAPVPVAGVDAFGVGAGQIGNLDSVNFANTPTGWPSTAKVTSSPSTRRTTGSSSTSQLTNFLSQSGHGGRRVGGEGSGLNQLNDPSGVALDAHGISRGRRCQQPGSGVRLQRLDGTYASSGTVVAGTGWLARASTSSTTRAG